MIDNGIVYLSLTEKSYPKRLAFLFLEEICKEFEADLRAEYGDEYDNIQCLMKCLLRVNYIVIGGCVRSKQLADNMLSSNLVRASHFPSLPLPHN